MALRINKTLKPIQRRTLAGSLKTVLFRANSNRAKKESMKGRVIWSGGTKVGSFAEPAHRHD